MFRDFEPKIGKCLDSRTTLSFTGNCEQKSSTRVALNFLRFCYLGFKKKLQKSKKTNFQKNRRKSENFGNVEKRNICKRSMATLQVN